MLVEVSYVEYHTAFVKMDDKYNILVEYEKTRYDDKWDGRHGEMEDLANECASQAMVGLGSDDADDTYCNLVTESRSGIDIYEA